MITLIGHGYIGTHIAKRLRNFEWISHLETPRKDTDFIINATGYIGHPNVDACEVNRELCLEANVLYPLSLEQKYSVPILHVTSGCVYYGYPKGGYREQDAPNLNFDNGSFYSGCKGLLQKLIEPYLSKSYLLRIRMPFDDTASPRNLLRKYERYSQLVDFENSMTSIDDFLSCVDLFVKERPEFGMYNIVNKGTTTTKQIVDLMKLEKQWFDPATFDQAVKAKRSNCSLNADKIKKIYAMPTIEEALERTVYNYRKNNL